MKITNLKNGKIAIGSPYNPEFVQRIKEAGGRWNSMDRTWEADERSLDIVRGIMREVYGQDDLPQETVTVRVTVSEYGIVAAGGPVVLFGRTVAAARGRDGGARIGNGVSFKKGGADSGGSAKHWYTIVDAESVFVLYDVPKLAIERKIGWDEKYGEFEIVRNGNGKDALITEKEALLKRLAEIDELLNA